jgi:8-oxo-dGTP pyrophosphatase MutT (NUDIX family)
MPRMDSRSPAAPGALPGSGRLAAAVGDVLSRTSPAEAVDEGHRAAVLILLYDLGGAPHFVLTKRTETLEHHPGQVSLPGGRWDVEDADLAVTALRETHEELGVPPAAVRVVGRLGDVSTMVSGFVVAPYVGWAEGPLSPVPSELEIARVLEVPVSSLLAADAVLPPSPDVVSLRYPLLGEDVWGATARILREFAAVVRASLSGGVA